MTEYKGKQRKGNGVLLDKRKINICNSVLLDKRNNYIYNGGNMGEKDLIEKKLEDYPEVFADIMNVLVMGKDYIQPKLLVDGPTESVYKAEGKNRGQFRDISKYYKDAEINIASLGIENQSEEDSDMPIRIMGYDYGQYRHQIDRGPERFPSISIVLNFSDKKWSQPKHLKELFSIPKELEAVVQDYEVKVYDIAYYNVPYKVDTTRERDCLKC